MGGLDRSIGADSSEIYSGNFGGPNIGGEYSVQRSLIGEAVGALDSRTGINFSPENQDYSAGFHWVDTGSAFAGVQTVGG
jgi:hypothetical protein